MDFKKIKQKVLKKYPDANIRLINNEYVLCNKSGFPIRIQDANLPAATSVRKAWENVYTGLQCLGLVSKAIQSESDAKIAKRIEKLTKEEDFKWND